jgi:hypothetical protein
MRFSNGAWKCFKTRKGADAEAQYYVQSYTAIIVWGCHSAMLSNTCKQSLGVTVHVFL